MVMTVLEANVEQNNWQKLEEVYATEVKTLDPGIVQTFLAQSKADENKWRIITLWESMEKLMLMRQSGETPRGVLMFRSVNAEPNLSVYMIVSQAVNPAA